LILNYIRLCDEQQGPNDYIPQLLSSIAEWKDFLPLLERDTLRQVRPLVPFQVARPAPHFGPLSQKSNLFDSLSGSKPTIRNGIHLGSGFAMSLGFSVPSSIDEPNEQRQRPEEGSGENSSSKKTPSGKKKKKKKSGVNENLSINVSPTRAVEIEESAIQ
jgi:hypothetical protein